MFSRTPMITAGVLASSAITDSGSNRRRGVGWRGLGRSATGSISQEERDRRNRLKKQAKQAKKRNR
jgi:hypothetical protein